VGEPLKRSVGCSFEMKLRSTILAFALIFLTGSFCPHSAKSRGLPRQLIAWVLKDACSGGCSQDQLADYRHHIKFELHDLNVDHIPELFVYIDHPDWCGNHFNCTYFVFQHAPNGYRLLASGYSALHVTNTLTNGYLNLESRHDTGVCPLSDGTWGRDIYLSVLHYGGKEYKSTELGSRCLKPIPIPAFRVGRIQQRVGPERRLSVS
jgi:hypothetical protein